MPLHRLLEATRTASPLLLAFALSAFASAAAPSAQNANDHRILVTAVAGDVHVSMAAVDADPRVGDEVLLPARIVTGDDGTLGLRQSRTSISIAPDSEIEIPEAAFDGQLIGRLVQWRGNVFYDVETRAVERLTVETPYLVAVVKGTQFNVAVLDDTTTISLFEGRLEIRDPDGRNVIDLDAGEVAIRSRDDTTIRVIDMNVANLPTFDANGTLVAADSERTGTDDSLIVDGDDTGSELDLGGESPGGVAELALRADASLGAEIALTDPALVAAVGGGVETALGSVALEAGLGAGLDPGAASVDLGAAVGFDTGALSADLGLDATADLGGASLGVDLDASLGDASLGGDLAAELDLGSGTAALDLGAAADLGAASLGADLGADLDLGGGTLDLGLGAGASVADLGLDAAADVGLTGDLAEGSLGATLDADIGLGDAGIGADLDASLDVGEGMLAGDLDAGLDLGGAGLDTGVDADVDLTSGELDLGIDASGLADAGVDAGLDLGGGDAGLGASVSLPGGIDASVEVDLGGDGDGGLLDIVDVDIGGGLLGGLL